MKNESNYENKFVPDGVDPFEGCLLRERARRGERFKYEYPDNGMRLRRPHQMQARRLRSRQACATINKPPSLERRCPRLRNPSAQIKNQPTVRYNLPFLHSKENPWTNRHPRHPHTLNNVIHLSNIALTFPPNVQALKNINLTVPAGRHVALVGRSGSGKTSLLAIIAGLLRPTAGQVSALGHNLNDLNEDALAALRRDSIGVVFQHFHLIDTMTAQENAALPLELAGRPNAQQQAKDMLAAVGLQDRLSHFPHQLSGGERQRVAIARAFVAAPPLLLADEPTGNLDDETSDSVLNLLLQIGRDNNCTLLFVTHNSAILPRFDEVWQMQNGMLHQQPPAPAAQ